MTKLITLRRRLLLQYLLTVGILLTAAETSLYFLSRFAGQQSLDTALGKDIENLLGSIEFERDGSVEIEVENHDRNLPLMDRAGDWQVLSADGSTLARRRYSPWGDLDLPAVGGTDPTPDTVQIADVRLADSGAVRAARLLVERSPPARFTSEGGAPETLTLDIRSVVDRTALDDQLQKLAWYLVGGFPIVLALAALGGRLLINRAVGPVEEAFQRERRFTGAASHELRTPLTALRAEVDVTLRQPRSAEEYVEAIGRAGAIVGRMTALVEGLLVLARADAGHLLSDAVEVSVAGLEAAVGEVVRQIDDQGRVTVTRTAPETLRMAGDSLLLAVAVRNLVENSLAYAPDGPIEVVIAAAVGGAVEISVQDQGPGVPADVLAELAKQKSYSSIPVPANGGRAGLGLSIARAVVESHRGLLSVENLPECGVLAVIRLPSAGKE